MELEALMQESVENLQKEFYNKKFYFSYSSLSKLLWNPVVFHQMYILGIRDEKTEAHLVQGKVIHCLLLEESKFLNHFVISPENLPTGNMRTVVDRVFSHHQELAASGDSRTQLQEFSDAILDIMRDMVYHQNLKTDQQRLDKVLTNEAHSYWSFLKAKGTKTLIDQETFDFCKNAVDLIKTNQQICDLIACNVTEFDNKEVYNELPLQLDVPNMPFGLKGIVDNIVIDHDKKIIYINDLKTTSKDLKDFPETVEYYSYWLQAIIYVTMTTMYFADHIDKGYTFKFHFVVIDRSYHTYAFPVSEESLNLWLERFQKTIEVAKWHYENKSYELPYEFAKSMVTL